MDMEIIEKLTSQMANGEIEKVLKELKSIFSQSPKLNEVIMQSARHSDLKESIRLGLLDYETASISKNKITLSILELITQIDEALESDLTIKSELKSFGSSIKIIQEHKGSGDNVAGNKIVNNK